MRGGERGLENEEILSGPTRVSQTKVLQLEQKTLLQDFFFFFASYFPRYPKNTRFMSEASPFLDKIGRDLPKYLFLSSEIHFWPHTCANPQLFV